MKIYVINVPADTERLSGFQAVYPAGLPEPTIYYAKTGEEIVVPGWWQGSANSRALTENLKAILEQEHNEPVMILEDDCAFDSDFVNKLNEFMEHVPNDWEVLYPGGRHADKLYAYPLKVNDYVLKCRYTAGTYCMIINTNAIQKVLSILNSENWTCHHTQDERLALEQWSGRLKAYAPLRFIAGQRAGLPSTIKEGWVFNRTTFFNDFRYFDTENKVFVPSGTLYDDEEEEEE